MDVHGGEVVAKAVKKDSVLEMRHLFGVDCVVWLVVQDGVLICDTSDRQLARMVFTKLVDA